MNFTSDHKIKSTSVNFLSIRKECPDPFGTFGRCVRTPYCLCVWYVPLCVCTYLLFERNKPFINDKNIKFTDIVHISLSIHFMVYLSFEPVNSHGKIHLVEVSFIRFRFPLSTPTFVIDYYPMQKCFSLYSGLSVMMIPIQTVHSQ